MSGQPILGKSLPDTGGYILAYRFYHQSIGHRSKNHAKNEKHYRPPQAWLDAKSKRAKQIGGWHCEICLTYLGENKIIGHHKVGNHRIGPNTVENCELRCRRCEGSYNAYMRKGFGPEIARAAVVGRFRPQEFPKLETFVESRSRSLVSQTA